MLVCDDKESLQILSSFYKAESLSSCSSEVLKHMLKDCTHFNEQFGHNDHGLLSPRIKEALSSYFIGKTCQLVDLQDRNPTVVMNTWHFTLRFMEAKKKIV